MSPLCVLLFSLASPLQAASSPPSLLMLGNSYLFVNDLDLRLRELLQASAPGFESCTSLRLAEGGYRFADHLAQADGTHGDTSWRQALVTGESTWTWVILQEQSQIPGFPESESYYVESLEAGGVLNGYAADRSASTLLLMTWGRRSGDPDNLELYPDFLTMQARLAEGYLRYAERWSSTDRPVWVAPAGLAFQHVFESLIETGADPLDPTGPFFKLYQEDGSHPSPLGTYLVACTLYASLTGQSPIGLAAPAGISAKDALFLQSAAQATVFEDTPGIDYPWEKSDTADTGGDSADTSDPADDTSDTIEDSTVDDTDTEPDTSGPDKVDPKEPSGCGCSSTRAASVWLILAVLAALLRSRAGRAQAQS